MCKYPIDLLFILMMPRLFIWPEDPLAERLPNFELILHFVRYVDGSELVQFEI